MKLNKLGICIIAFILSSSITVFATYKTHASKVKYVKEEKNINNVESALDDLYSLLNSKRFSFYDEKVSARITHSQVATNIHSNIPKGHYLLISLRTGCENKSSGLINMAQNNISLNISGNGTYNQIGELGEYYINLDDISTINVTTAKVGTSKNQAGYLYTFLYKINY